MTTHLRQLIAMLEHADVLYKEATTPQDRDAFYEVELTHSGNYPVRFLFDEHGTLTGVEVES